MRTSVFPYKTTQTESIPKQRGTQTNKEVEGQGLHTFHDRRPAKRTKQKDRILFLPFRRTKRDDQNKRLIFTSRQGLERRATPAPARAAAAASASRVAALL